jgi:hypothetical protein
MANPWFRMYAEFATDPKVQMLSEADQRRLTMLLCFRCNDHVTLHDTEVTFMLRINNDEWKVTKTLFIERGFINNDNEILNWDKRQFASDTSKNRVAAYRERKKQESNNDVTLQKQKSNAIDTEQIQNRTDINTLVPNDVGDDCPHQEIINLYHKHLPMLTQVKSWTAKRSTALKTRWREDHKRQSLDWWAKLFNYISKSDFLTGKASEWQADLEWIINSSNLVKIIEGKYENKQAVTA